MTIEIIQYQNNSALTAIGSATLNASSYSWRGLELMVIAPGVFDASRKAFDFAQEEHQIATKHSDLGDSKEAFYANLRATGWIALSAAYTGLAGVIAADAIFGWTHNAMYAATYGEEQAAENCATCPPCANGTLKGDCSAAREQGYAAGAKLASDAFEDALYNQ